MQVSPDADLPGYQIQAEVKTTSETGVEMEALTAVSVTALTLYDMAKGLEKSMQIEGIHLVSKTGVNQVTTTMRTSLDFNKPVNV